MYLYELYICYICYTCIKLTPALSCDYALYYFTVFLPVYLVLPGGTYGLLAYYAYMYIRY